MSQTTEIQKLEQILRYLTECRSITGCSEPVTLKDHCREMMTLMRDCLAYFEAGAAKPVRRADLICRLSRFLGRY